MCSIYRNGRSERAARWRILLVALAVAGSDSVTDVAAEPGDAARQIASVAESPDAVKPTAGLRGNSDSPLPDNTDRSSTSAPVQPRSHVLVELDGFGRYTVDDRSVPRVELLDRVRQKLERQPELVVTVAVAAGALPLDVAELSELIRRAGAAEHQIEMKQLARPVLPAADRGAATALIHSQVRLHRVLLERIVLERDRLGSRLVARRADLERGAAVVSRCLSYLRDYLSQAASGAATRPAR